MEIRIRSGFWFLLALMVRTLPLPWLSAGLLAAALHEFSHLLALYLFGGRCRRLYLSPGGAVLEASALAPGAVFCCALAGPAGSLMLGLVRPILPVLSLCGILQGLWNLLPLPCSDGGLMLSLLLERCLPPRYCVFVLRFAAVLSLAALPFLPEIRRFFPSAIIPIVLIFTLRAGKKPCKYPL